MASAGFKKNDCSTPISLIISLRFFVKVLLFVTHMLQIKLMTILTQRRLGGSYLSQRNLAIGCIFINSLRESSIIAFASLLAIVKKKLKTQPPAAHTLRDQHSKQLM